MRQARFTDHSVITVLKSVEAGLPGSVAKREYLRPGTLTGKQSRVALKLAPDPRQVNTAISRRIIDDLSVKHQPCAPLLMALPLARVT